jgi:chemotaxis protein CheD
MNPYGTKLPVVYLKPGEIFFSKKPALIMTILGSCVSATMYNRWTGFGGICHILLPRCRNGKCTGTCDEMFRYAGCTLRHMVTRFDREGIPRMDIEVKLFGGAEILLSLDRESKRKSVGKQNIDVARETLLKEGLKTAASNIGGAFGRKLYFFTNTGEVLVKRIKRTALPKEEIE